MTEKIKFGNIRFYGESPPDDKNDKNKEKEIGFVPPKETNPFAEAKNVEELNDLFDEFEHALRNKDPDDPKSMNYQKDWGALNELYKKQFQRLKAIEAKNMGFIPKNKKDAKNDTPDKPKKKIGFIQK